MTTYKTCPAYPEYEASRCGSIRRLPWTKITKTGRAILQPATVLKHVGRDRAYVTLSGTFVRWSVMVDDAWQDDNRPAPTYIDGIVMTLAEYIEYRRSSRELNC